MRRALIVGIDDYPNRPLTGCVKDAQKMTEVLSRHESGLRNFDCKMLAAPPDEITRAELRHQVARLFADPADIALFYFSGHGAITAADRYLVTQDYTRNDEGVSMEDILKLADRSPVREIVILLDCCYAGGFASVPVITGDRAVLRDGMTVLAASRSMQFARETPTGGAFTSLVYDALNGGAADLLGDVSVAGVYSYADPVFGAWDQRPLFKSNVSQLTPLRCCKPRIDPKILQRLPGYFPTADYLFPLDPSYEPAAEPHNFEHEQIFADLQDLRDVHLLAPVGEKHLYYAAMNSKACRLTPLGQYYWQLSTSGRL